MYNYNTNEKESKGLFEALKNVENYIKNKQQKERENLVNMLYDTFPTILKVAADKESLKEGEVLNIKKTRNAFIEFGYIYFNKYTFNHLVIDIDNKELNGIEIMQRLWEKEIMQPTWILETDKGYQIGFKLKKPFNLFAEKLSNTDKKLIKYTKAVLENLIEYLNADANAKRLQGFWRNPTCKNYKNMELIISNNEFNLKDFNKIKNKNQEKRKKYRDRKFSKEKDTIKNIAKKIILEGEIEILTEIGEGIRNSLLWYLGMHLSKLDENWEDKLYTYNINLKEPLTKKEFEQIMESIRKYNTDKQNFVKLGEYESWTKELKREYMKQYRLKKGLIKKTREKQKAESKQLIIKAIKELKNKGEKISYRKIAKEAGLSLKTVNKYMKEIKINYPQFFE